MKWLNKVKESNVHSRIFVCTMLVLCGLVIVFTSLIERSVQDRTLAHLQQLGETKLSVINVTMQQNGFAEIGSDVFLMQKPLQRMLRERFDDSARFTLIDEDGEVIADSNVDYQTLVLMDNHASRPEVILADAQGYGVSSRFSKTLGSNLIYFAQKAQLINGQNAFIRIAIKESSEVAVMNQIRLMAAGFFFLIVTTLIIMRLLEKQRIASLNEMHKRQVTKKAEEITYIYNELQTVTAMFSICKTEEEALNITQDFVAKCFPNTELVFEIGLDGEYDVYDDGCWASRRNAIHLNRFPDGKSNCTHTWATDRARRFDYAQCFPIQSDTLVMGRASLYFKEAQYSLVTEKYSIPLEFLFNNLGITFTRLNISEQMLQKAYSDPLTGIWNRRYFFERLDEWVEDGKSFHLLLLDADHFKAVNDDLGHDVGDMALKRIASTARECAKKDQDIVARVGGEEFAIIIDCDDPAQIQVIYDRISNQLLTKPLPDGRSLTLSAGASHYPSDAEDIDVLYKYADQALYRAKRAGRKQMAHYGETDVQSIELVR